MRTRTKARPPILETCEPRRLLYGQLEILRDIELRDHVGAQIQEIVAGPGVVYFTADPDAISHNGYQPSQTGEELWISDGTSSGTRMVGDLLGGLRSSSPRDLVMLGDVLYFTANTAPAPWAWTGDRELWRSDGTPEGTRLVANINTTLYAGADPKDLLNLNGVLYFTADDGRFGRELYRSDGTKGGTEIVRDLRRGSAGAEPGHLTAFGDRLFFTADDGVHGRQLWTTDGTKASTRRVTAIVEPDQAVLSITATDDRIFLVVGAPQGEQALWSFDPDSEVLEHVSLGRSLAFIDHPTAIGSRLFFSAFSNAGGVELWTSDGTVQGTRQVIDLFRSGSSSPAELTVFGSTLYFAATHRSSASNAFGRELWRTDGTAAGTQLVRDIVPGANGSSPTSLVVAGNHLLFQAKAGSTTSLWRTDGTMQGTQRVFPEGMGPSSFGTVPAVAMDERAFFVADDGVHGLELWVSDGSPGGTAMVHNTRPSNDGSSPYGITDVDGRIFFGVYGTPQNGLWVSDGTEAGTRHVHPVRPLRVVSTVQAGASFDGRYLFWSDHLWISDGTTEGTRKIKQISPPTMFGTTTNRGFVTLDGFAFFVATDGLSGFELWRTDGTEVGTTLVRDIRPGSASANITSIYTAGRHVYLYADDGVHGRELWRSDGTEAGTFMLMDYTPGAASSTGGGDVVEHDGLAHFLIGSSTHYTSSRSLMRSDGSIEGTKAILDTAVYGEPKLVEHNGAIYFTAHTLATAGELFRLGRNDLLPVPVTAFQEYSPGIRSLTSVGHLLYFAARERDLGIELWVHNSRTKQTSLVSNIGIADAGGDPSHLTAVGNLLAFSAGNHQTLGTELWLTDGTEEGTHVAGDLNPGRDSTSLAELTASGGKLFFFAVTPLYGSEVWMFTPDRKTKDARTELLPPRPVSRTSRARTSLWAELI